MESFLFHSLLNTPRRAQPGFTLIEMLVVLAIIIIITAIALSGQGNFDRTLALNNATYDIGLSIREAQSYGVSSQAYAGTTNAGYGIYLNTGTPSTYVLFADTNPAVASGAQPDAKPGDGLYSSSANPPELVKTYTLNNGFSVSSVCAYAASGAKTCSPTMSELSVTFGRPNSRTVVKGRTASWSTYRSACLTVTGRSSDSRYLYLAETGQVSVVAACP